MISLEVVQPSKRENLTTTRRAEKNHNVMQPVASLVLATLKAYGCNYYVGAQ